MLGGYNLSLQGDSHKSSGTVCQDASCIKLLPCGWLAAAVADGVGSAKYSDIGSELAVRAATDYIYECCPSEWDINNLTNVLITAYETALEKITEKAEEDGNPLSEYDTTLTVAVYNGDCLAYAHVGDGGIITLTKNGDFSIQTTAQKGDEFNSVNPLRSRKWEFGISESGICAFAMLTDGIYDIVCPWLLSNQEQKVYINYIRSFMDRNLLKADTEEDFENIKREAESFLFSSYNSSITDDKTIAVIINTDVLPDVKDVEYYAEPDWDKLKEEKMEKLYAPKKAVVIEH